MVRYWFWRPAIEHRSIRRLDDQYRGWLTPAGRVMLWATLAMGLLHRETTFEADIGLGFAGSALLTAVAIGFLFRPRVRMRRFMPPAPAEGELLTYRVTVENVGQRVARRILVEERDLPSDLRPVGEPPIIDELQPGETVSVTLQLSCKARGAYQLRRLQASSDFPSTLFKWPCQTRETQPVFVYPKLIRLDRVDIPLGRSYQPGGISAASRVGDSQEFLGTREWRRSDRLRDLHWPSFARTGRPIVKEFQEEYFVRVALVIDAEVETHKAEVLFERGLSYAAGAAEVLARQDAIIDLIAAGSEIHRFQTGRALAQFDNLLEVLACVRPEWEVDLAAVQEVLTAEAKQLSAVLFVFNLWNEARASLVRSVRDRGVAVRVLLLSARKPFDGLSPDEQLFLP